MPEFTVSHIAVLALVFAVGALFGWILRSDRSAREKIAVNAGWQEQLEMQHAGFRRLEEQNRRLLQRLGEFQASHRDSQQRAKELTATLKRAVERRDELNRRIKDVRTDMQNAIEERDRLQAELEERRSRDDTAQRSLRDKDSKIFKLSRELTSWQGRLPPLVDKFRQRDLEAQQLRSQLEEAEERIAELEAQVAAHNARIEPLEPGALTGGLNACNEQYEATLQRVPVDFPGRLEEGKHIAEGLADNGAGRNGAANGEPPGPRSLAPTLEHAYAGEAYPGSRDDLQRIKGVGPAIERTLNDFGIYRFDQVAQISEYDIDRIAERLRGFRSRIYREDWIGQARALCWRD
jgi:predicted flap endonuclease-1-like 5' DNA nuclease/regulator of replication initiation timing